jgi:hypothetical protein
MEDGGCLDIHAQVFLLGLARIVVYDGGHNHPIRLNSAEGVARGEHAAKVLVLVHRWQRHLSFLIHLALSRQQTDAFALHPNNCGHSLHLVEQDRLVEHSKAFLFA